MAEIVSKGGTYDEQATNARRRSKRRSGIVEFRGLKNPEKKGPCELCEKEDIKHYSCAHCVKQYFLRYSIMAHLRKHKHPPVICQICNVEFEFNYQLQQHMVKHSNEHRFSCDVCQRTFKRSSTLLNHKKIHEPKRFSCKHCTKKFTQKSHLDVHMRGHDGVKPYSCSICSKQFTQKTSLNNHVMTHTGLKPHRCELCEKWFRQVSNLNQHIQKHHTDKTCKKPNSKREKKGNDNDDDKTKRKISKNRKNKASCKTKKRLGISLTWFSCEKCKKTITGEDNIVKHMEICL